MKNKNISIFLILFSFLLSHINSFSFGVKDKYEKYCFKKYIYKGDQITLSFVITSFPKELIHVEFTHQKTKHDEKKIIYQVNEKDQGSYKSSNPEDEGYYELCFFSKKGKDIYVSMEYYTLYEDHNIKQIATDKEIKTINNDINEMKNAFDKIKSNARHLNSRKYRHIHLLNNLIESIKRLTYLKIFFVAVFSAFQIYVIQKFFGPDKRVSSIKGAFSDKSIL